MVYWVLHQIDWREAQKLLLRLPAWSLLLALLLFNLSQIVSIVRINLFYRSLGILMDFFQQFRLYYLGMFYNLFIPGGIGGDAYKVYWLRQQHEVRTKALIQVSLADRLSGLGAIIFWLGLFFIATPFRSDQTLSGLAGLAWFLHIPVMVWFIRRVLPAGYPVIWRSILPAILVQLLQVLCIMVLLLGWGVSHDQLMLYGFVFLLSSVAAVVPLTFGGVGARELTFLSFSSLLDIDASLAVTVAMLFFLLTAFSSLLGGFLKP